MTRTQPRPVLFDTDMGADDWMAALMLLRHPAVDLKAITVVGTGLAELKPGVEQALRLVKLAGKEGKVPVAVGRSEPLRGKQAFPEGWRVTADTFQEVPLDRSTQVPSQQHAARAILSYSHGISCNHSADQKLVLIAGGPLTNIAAAFGEDPSLAERLEMIYCMGGAVNVEGNAPEERASGKHRVAEWNTYLDPCAAAVVLSSGVPITLVPLDATNHVPLTKEFHDRLQSVQKTQWAAFVCKVLDQSFNTGRDKGFCFWDPLTVAISVDEQRFTTVNEAFLEVVVEEGDAWGQIRKTKEGGHRVRYCTGANKEEFEDFFVQTLNS